MASGDVRLDRRAIEALKTDDDVARALEHFAGPIVREAQAHAPKLTGAGAASIRAERTDDVNEETIHISWDRSHFYMYFHERGTRYLSARPFLVPTVGGLR